MGGLQLVLRKTKEIGDTRYNIYCGTYYHMLKELGELTPSYILHTRAFGTYLLRGLFTLQKKL
jgi:hypothetical protein